MSKRLTISIAAYNVEQYIRSTLESCIIPEIELLDVIVVDDGAKDSTAMIADEYAAMYPNSIRVIRKQNGGYGSTVNTSISLAKGEFFKLLDGDDWFDKEALSKLVRLLDSASFDMVVNPYVERFGENESVVDQASPFVEGISPLSSEVIPRRLSMHSVTIRTQLLRDSGLILPEHRLYTDTLYDVVPLPYVKSVYISHFPVYQYRLGRDGQSMSLEGLIAHRDDMEKLVWNLYSIYSSTPDDAGYKSIIEAWLVDDAASLLFTLFSIPDKEVAKAEVDRYLKQLNENRPLFDACKKRSKRFSVLQLIGTGPFFSIGRKLGR